MGGALALAASTLVTVTSSASAVVSGGTLISGAIVYDGAAVPDAYVWVKAWPNTGYLDDNFVVDAAVPMKTVWSGYADSTGHYSLASWQVPSLPAMYHEADGSMTFEVEAQSDSTQTFQSYTMSAATDGASLAVQQGDVDTASPGNPATTTLDLATGNVDDSVDGSTTDYTTDFADPGAVVMHAPVNPDIPIPPKCDGPFFVKKMGFKPERFMRFWSNYHGRATVDIEESASHSLGVGVALDSGAWHASGKVTVDVEQGSGATNTYENDLSLGNYINYNQYRIQCNSGAGRGWARKDMARPGRFHALLVPELRKSIFDYAFPLHNLNYCQPYNGGSYRKHGGKGSHYDLGVDIGPISVEASASYSTNFSITWHISAPEFMCGTTNQGWAGAPEAGAEKNVKSCTPPPCTPDP